MNNLSGAILISIVTITAVSSESCHTPQYLEAKKVGVILCDFPEDMFGILWYNTTDVLEKDPQVTFRDSVKGGSGYASGEFDICKNGSLVINYVSLQHETTFRVAYFRFSDDVPVFIDVEVFVIVKPTIPFPVFYNCGNKSNICFSKLETPVIQCTVCGVRPIVSLNVTVRTVFGDEYIPTELLITSDEDLYTSKVVTRNAFHYSSLLVVLVCKASSQPEILEIDESLLLVENVNFDLSHKKPMSIIFQRGREMQIMCSGSDTGVVIWKRLILREGSIEELLLYSVSFREPVTKVFSNDVTLGNNGSLVFNNVQVQQEGMYYCLFGDGLRNDVTTYEVTVYVSPVPENLNIEGCAHHQYCVLEANYEGSLTCTVKGIRPRVELELTTFREDDAPSISFVNQQETVKDNGETFDVTITSKFYLRDVTLTRLTIECRVKNSNGLSIGLKTTLDLLFKKENLNTTKQDGETLPAVVHSWIILLCSGLVIALSFAALTIIIFWRRQKAKAGSMQEDIPTNQNHFGNTTEKKRQFVHQLKERYKDLYGAVYPIPYVKDRAYCVDNIFVECKLEILVSSNAHAKNESHWMCIPSYRNIFEEERVKSTRRILEGEPGYGKSTIALQLAYDWCNCSPSSPLKDVEILIFLRLRDLGDEQSIYKTIRQFLLPKDSQLAVGDIENILTSSNSVVFILDGFDEYRHHKSGHNTDIISIIARDMFQNFEVFLTTRSSVMPNQCPPSTKRIRLQGFTDESRSSYIRKAVADGDDELVCEIEKYLTDNPVLNDLCQVPLFFVIFAQMMYERKEFRNLNSATQFFRYMISGFHSHMINKLCNINDVMKLRSLEIFHHQLDSVAFEALSENTQLISWEKEELSQKLGEDLYYQYLRIGILVEESYTCINDDYGPLSTQHVQNKTKVRFYHKMFCEWYAAHYVSDYLQKNSNVDFSEFFQHRNPANVPYLYRFACGLTSYTAQIMKYLINMEVGDTVAILCTLENEWEFDDLREVIVQLCERGIIISGHDSLLLQRLSLMVLETAAQNGLTIRYVRLHNCLESVNISDGVINTSSGLAFSSNVPVTWLAINLSTRRITQCESTSLLEFATLCDSLEYISFTGCVPPWSFNISSLSSLKTKGITVRWVPFKPGPEYFLNLDNGHWTSTYDGTLLSKAESLKMMKRREEMIQSSSEESHSSKVQGLRQRFRKDGKIRLPSKPVDGKLYTKLPGGPEEMELLTFSDQ